MNDQSAIRREDVGAKPLWAMSRAEAEAWAIARAGLPPRRKRRWWLLALVLVVVAGAAVAAWQFWPAGTEAAASEAPGGAAEAPGGAAEAPGGGAPAAPERIQINADEHALLAPLDLRRTVRVIGTLTPIRSVDLSAETSGQVETVLARPGDRVEEGEVLVQVAVERLTLDRDLALSNADATRAQVALAEGQRDRTRTLVERGVATASLLEEAESSASALRSTLAALDDQVSAAELALREATLLAPFSGVVSERSVDPGAVVSAGTVVLSLVDLAQVEMLAQAPASAGSLMREGQAVEVSVDGVADRTFAGEVTRIAPVAQEGTRTITAYVAIDNEDGTLLGGMFATGEIVVAESLGALAVPTEAIREDDDGDHVMILEDGALVRRDVVRGEDWEGGVTEVEGLEVGADVVIVPLEGIEPGQQVDLVEF